MEEKEHNPTEINSFYEISKKRKLPAEHLGLPSPKHKHSNEASPSKSVFLHDGLPETELMTVQFSKGNPNVMCIDEGLTPESVKDSNSFSDESDSATSVFCGAKLELNQALSCTHDSSESTHFCVGSSTAMESSSTEQEVAFARGENQMEAIHKIQEHMLELDSHEEHVNDDLEQCTEQELEDLFRSNGLNPNTYVLSSGRWTVNHEAQSRDRTPTIDREFEQFFSMLML
ncbi:Protein FAR-RED ELONGATED HYPOCOTYL 1, partial [Cucurbita argyrosperma subsp. argyrosperma]